MSLCILVGILCIWGFLFSLHKFCWIKIKTTCVCVCVWTKKTYSILPTMATQTCLFSPPVHNNNNNKNKTHTITTPDPALSAPIPHYRPSANPTIVLKGTFQKRCGIYIWDFVPIRDICTTTPIEGNTDSSEASLCDHSRSSVEDNEKEDTQKNIRLICAFEPILGVILYTVVVRSTGKTNRYFRVTKILDSEALPWSDNVAQDLFCGDYKQDESFVDYVVRHPYLTGSPLTFRQLAWLKWIQVRAMQESHDVDAFDHDFIREVIKTNRHAGNLSPGFAWTVYPETLPDGEAYGYANEKFLFIECLKQAMKRYRVLTCTDAQLVGLQYANIRPSEEAYEALEKEGVVRHTPEGWTFGWKIRTSPLKDGEPIDYSVDSLTLPPPTPFVPSKSNNHNNVRNDTRTTGGGDGGGCGVTVASVGVVTSTASLPLFPFCESTPPRQVEFVLFREKMDHHRMYIHRGLDSYACLNLALQGKSRVLFVFGSKTFCARRILYETRMRQWHTMMERTPPYTQFVFAKRTDVSTRSFLVTIPRLQTTIEQNMHNNAEEETTVIMTEETLFKRYMMFQTCSYEGIQKIVPNLFEVVVLFHDTDLPRRWIHFCERSCGPQTILIAAPTKKSPSCPYW
jgi:hypothetical protein